VNKEDLKPPADQDAQDATALSIAGLRAQGKEYHCPKEYIDKGYPSDIAQEMAHIRDHLINIQDHQMELKEESNTKDYHVFCYSCDAKLHNIKRVDLRSLKKNLMKHAQACNKACSYCGVPCQKLYQEYLYSNYEYYVLTLCEGETKVSRDVFIRELQAHNFITKNGSKNFNLAPSSVFGAHCRSRKPLGNPLGTPKMDCEKWYKAMRLWRSYTQHWEIDALDKEKVKLYPGNEYLDVLKNFKSAHYKDMGDGSYGSSKRHIRYGGDRHRIIHAIHESVKLSQLKNTQPITKFCK
jgi:hypothetical protein